MRIAKAEREGVYKGRKRALSEEQLIEMQQRITNGEKKAHIAKSLGVSRVTLYQYLNTVCTPRGE
ncbi:helix-turn-helix domain-containing protein [Candidatus Paracaedibacter symbiosus]|uniref:helix-turn-helix domain-containing protein n=1 Tax=Candidatus Paracaedibacter symbiosus TaxID=244582 RepID=UPI0012EC3F5A|nr:helix-turn-helix domain-containing protein [Candidatus Paracaedibacter symbiosus]